jgi:hypothetical protein
MINIHFLTFGGPSLNYHNAVQRICNEASQFNIFNRIVGLTDQDLKCDTEFWDKNHSFIETNSRGYGYWLWKSYIVKKQLEIMSDNDVLVYADAGCSMNIHGKDRLLAYCEMVKDSPYGIVSFQMSQHVERIWTKMDIVHHLQASDEFITSGQLCATAFIIRKHQSVTDLVDKWYETSCMYRLIDDSPSQISNYRYFLENRHDQSIWSILRKKHGTVTLKDETDFLNWNRDGIEFPIWATRKKHGFAHKPKNFILFNKSRFY